jgi:hypothetical protein
MSRHTLLPALVLLFVAGVFSSQHSQAASRSKKKQRWAVPVIMEEATMRGRLIILEDRTQDRRVIENLNIEVWSRVEDEETAEDAKKDLLHTTRTDDLGMFQLPLLNVGDYVLTISELDLNFQVVPKAEDRKDQREPKIVLIMLPKESIGH